MPGPSFGNTVVLLRDRVRDTPLYSSSDLLYDASAKARMLASTLNSPRASTFELSLLPCASSSCQPS
ncbi:hypothetical protein D3C87_2099110 [compost metagenome]